MNAGTHLAVLWSSVTMVHRKPPAHWSLRSSVNRMRETGRGGAQAEKCAGSVIVGHDGSAVAGSRACSWVPWPSTAPIGQLPPRLWCRILAGSTEVWTGHRLLETLKLAIEFVHVAGTDVRLDDQIDAGPIGRHSVSRSVDDIEYLVPFTLDGGEHRVGAIR